MVFIQDIDDQNFVYNMLSHLGIYYPVWLGLHDVTNEEQWEWVSGENQAPNNKWRDYMISLAFHYILSIVAEYFF